MPSTLRFSSVVTRKLRSLAPHVSCSSINVECRVYESRSIATKIEFSLDCQAVDVQALYGDEVESTAPSIQRTYVRVEEEEEEEEEEMSIGAVS